MEKKPSLYHIDLWIDRNPTAPIGGPGQMEGGWLRSCSINLKHKRYLVQYGAFYRYTRVLATCCLITMAAYGALDQARDTN
jgi:hypothetical protein